jgi:hypothetical protein
MLMEDQGTDQNSRTDQQPKRRIDSAVIFEIGLTDGVRGDYNTTDDQNSLEHFVF